MDGITALEGNQIAGSVVEGGDSGPSADVPVIFRLRSRADFTALSREGERA